MLTRCADVGIRAPKYVLGLAGIVLVLFAVFGAPVASHLSAGGFNDPKSQSSKANDLLADSFDAGDANLILQVTAPQGVTSPAARAVGLDLVRKLHDADHTSQVTSFWTAPASQAAGLRSKDGKSGIVVARVAGDDATAPKRGAKIADTLVGKRGDVSVRAGGIAVTFQQINDQVKDDLAVAESVAIPLTVLALIWVFGSLLASLLPLVIGLSAIIGTMAILRGLAAFTDVSVYALNMTTALGLALAIDYSLFIVSRYREEIGNGSAPDAAVRRTMQTAGRTVLFSALVVGLSLAALLVFPVYFLRSFAYAGIAVVLLSTIAALVLLPALLALLGTKVDKWDLRALVRRILRRPPATPKPVEQGFWYRFATAVMRRAVPVGLLVTGLLVVLGLPFFNIQFGYPDERVLPPSASSYQVGADLRNDFTTNAGSTITVVAPDIANKATTIAPYAEQLSTLDHVTVVAAATGTYADGRQVATGSPTMVSGGSTYLQVRTDTDPRSSTAKNLLTDVEHVASPWPVKYTGATAENRDSLAALGHAMPYAILLIVLATLIVLFLFTGSVLLPIKALVLNALSLTATFGAMVWVFQDGHLGWLFPDLTVTGYITPTMPPLMFCLAFGLSMDYEVFLLSRIREAWLESDRTSEDNTRAVALGLGRTGRIVTAAALLMAIVFASMATSSVGFMMLFGTGLTLAVLMDATVVRGVLVPAFMKIAGRWNWWAPRPLARLHARIGLAEGPTGPAVDREQELSSA
jgi:RND superfamily putative drug exporter